VIQNSDGSAGGPRTLSEVLAPMRRHLAVVLVAVVLGAIAGYLYVARTPGHYVATTTVLVTATGVEDTSNSKVTINLDTEAQVVSSDSVLAAAVKELKLTDSPRSFGQNVTVAVPPNTEILSIAVTANNSAQASRSAAAVAEAYLATRNSAAGAIRTARLRALVDRSKSLQAQDDKATAALVKARDDRDDVEKAQLSASSKRLERQLSTISEQINGLQLKVISGGRVLSPATAVASNAKLTQLLGIVTGTALGLFLGLGAAKGLDRLRRRIRSAGDATRLTGFPVLVRDPISLGSALDPSNPATDPKVARVFTRLRNELEGSEAVVRTVMVAAASRHTSTAESVAICLAYAYRRGGRTVALLDNSVWEPDPTLDGPRDDVALQIREAIGQVGAKADVIIVVAPDFTSSADAQTVAAGADVVLVVVERSSTRVRDLKDAEEQLEAVRARGYLVMTAGPSWPARATDLFRRLRPAAHPDPVPASVPEVKPESLEPADVLES
jgi:capsular polysaccharide biosynthesis protein